MPFLFLPFDYSIRKIMYFASFAIISLLWSFMHSLFACIDQRVSLRISPLISHDFEIGFKMFLFVGFKKSCILHARSRSETIHVMWNFKIKVVEIQSPETKSRISPWILEIPTDRKILFCSWDHEESENQKKIAFLGFLRV